MAGKKRDGSDVMDDGLTEEAILENVQALVEKERKLMEFQLLEKEKELEKLRVELKKQQSKRLINSYAEGEEGTVNVRLLMSSQRSKGNEREDGDEEESESEEEEEEWEDISGPESAESKERILTANFSNMVQQNLSVLNLKNQGVNEAFLQQLGASLMHASSVHTVNLSDNNLSPRAAPFLAGLVSHQKIRLKSLDISGNLLNLQAATTICKALHKNATLTHLDLSNNPFSHEPEAGRVMGHAIGQASPNLTSLKITIGEARRDRTSNTKQGNTATFVGALFALHSGITSLGMINSSLPKVGIAALCSEAILQYYLLELDLRMAFIGNTGAALIGKSLVKAHSDAVHKRKAEKLIGTGRTRLCLLEKLCLKMNAISRVGCNWIAKAIASSSTLTEVDLSSNELDDSSAKLLAKALQSTTAPIRILNLAHNKFFQNGADNERGALALAEVVAEKRTLIDLGTQSSLNFSVRVKRMLSQNLEVNQRNAAMFNLRRNDDGSAEDGTIELFKDQSRKTLVDCPQSMLAANFLEDAVELLNVMLPSSLLADDYISNPQGNTFAVNVSWETNPGFDWRILRKRQEVSFDEPDIEVIIAGDASEYVTTVQSTEKSERIRVWQRYEVPSEGWKPDDQLVLEVGILPAHHTIPIPKRLGGAFVQNLKVSADLDPWRRGKFESIEPLRNNSNQSKAKLTLLTDDILKPENSCVLHSREWQNDVLLHGRGKYSANVYTKLHEIYVHTGTRWGKLYLRWNIRIQTLDGKVVHDKTKYHHRVAGMEWQIEKSGSSSRYLRGSCDEGRVTVKDDDFAFASYTVDISSLDIFVGDTVSLWVRPPNHVLPATSIRKPQQVFSVRSTLTQLIVAGNEKDVKLVGDLRLDLAGARPFLITKSPYSWA